MNTQPRISLIVAIASNRVIGKDNHLLWHLPDDLKRFKRLTSGHPIIIGRKTFESIGRALPRRTNIVVTSQSDYPDQNIILALNLTQAIKKATQYDQEEIFIIGGESIYIQAMNLAQRLYLTVLDQEFQGDRYFPEYKQFDTVIESVAFQSGDMSGTYLTLEK